MYWCATTQGRVIRREIAPNFGGAYVKGLDFYCSQKRPGPVGEKLTTEQWRFLRENLMKQNAVTVHCLELKGRQEKGVDVAVAMRLVEVAETCPIVCLVSSDKDYVPVLDYLKRKGTYVVTLGFEKHHPIELRNLSYMFIDLEPHVDAFLTGMLIDKAQQ